MRKGDGDMKEKKRVWFTFNLCEADAFEQYLEKMALQGWFLESVGGAVMRFYRAQPEKRRYAALLVPESSSLIGAVTGKQSSCGSSARKQAGFFSATASTGRYFIQQMMQQNEGAIWRKRDSFRSRKPFPGTGR